jgi:hypothetical protein
MLCQLPLAKQKYHARSTASSLFFSHRGRTPERKKASSCQDDLLSDPFRNNTVVWAFWGVVHASTQQQHNHEQPPESHVRPQRMIQQLALALAKAKLLRAIDRSISW